MPTLPNELLDLIISYASNATLARMCQCSHALRGSVEPVLYSVSNNDPRFIRTLVERESLRRHVIHYDDRSTFGILLSQYFTAINVIFPAVSPPQADSLLDNHFEKILRDHGRESSNTWELTVWDRVTAYVLALTPNLRSIRLQM